MNFEEIKNAILVCEDIKGSVEYYEADEEEYPKAIDILQVLAEAVLSASECLPKRKESPKGKDCSCNARCCDECGCTASWADYDGYNIAIDLCTTTLAKKLVGLEAVMVTAHDKYYAKSGEYNPVAYIKHLSTAIKTYLGSK